MKDLKKKDLKKKYKEQQKKEFAESLPVNKNVFLQLFDFLDKELTVGCRNDFTLLEKFCCQEEVDINPLLEWLKGHGAYCDCEILANVEELFDYDEAPPSVPVPKKSVAQNRKLPELTVSNEFCIKQIPSPWVLTEVNDNGNIHYLFRIGKKSGYYMELLFDFPVDKLNSNEFLHKYWNEKNTLLNENDVIIERNKILTYDSVQVKSPNWLPAFIFIYEQHKSWCLVMKTETTRLRGDLKETEKLLKEVNA